MPEMNLTLPIEADLHRVLPYSAIRACLITVCPQCQYSWWTNTFNRHYFLPVGISETPTVDHARKFAHAILTGRKNSFHILDQALLAMNGYWCAKESNQDPDKWLSLAIQEISAALADKNWQGNRSRYYYLLAEFLRLNGRFEQSLKAFNLVDSDANLPQNLIDNQKSLAHKQNKDAVLLSNEQVREIFFPKLKIESITEEKQNTEISAIPKANTQVSNTNSFVNSTNNTILLPPKRTRATV
jgi:hypothetical protein